MPGAQGKRNGDRRSAATVEPILSSPVQISTLILVLVAVPILFCMVTWVAATAYRLYFPERSIPLENQLSIVSSWEDGGAEVPLPIGVREIKEDERRRLRVRADHYRFDNGMSSGLPADWLTDVERRRN